MSEMEQLAEVVRQFTLQAAPFSRLGGRSHEESLELLFREAGLGPEDEVLDVACGPGLVATAAARVARHVTGIDVTPAMIERARDRQAELGLSNLEWHVGDVSRLPFPDGRFSLTTCRYALHHFPNPSRVVAEMARVTRAGGRLALADVFVTPETRDAYDAMERLRDPSHVRALTLEELLDLAGVVGLEGIRTAYYRMEVDLETLMRGSFPDVGNAERVRAMLLAHVGRQELGVAVEPDGDAYRVAYPIAVATGYLPSPAKSVRNTRAE